MSARDADRGAFEAGSPAGEGVRAPVATNATTTTNATTRGAAPRTTTKGDDPSARVFDALLAKAADRSTGTGIGPAVVVGRVVAFEQSRALVVFDGQPGTAAIAARSVVDLHEAHVGRAVALAFERGDALRPIVMGWLRDDEGALAPDASGSVEIDADGERLVVTAKEQLVLRCGHASVTLTKAGKVLINGKYVSSRSSGVNRIKGGSVQIN